MIGAFMQSNPNPRYLGNWENQTFINDWTTANGAINRVFLTAIYVPRACSVDQLNMSVSTSGGAATNLRLALYADSSFAPVNLLGESGNIAADSTGLKTWSITTPIRVAPGIVWAALETADATIAYRRLSTTGNLFDDSTGQFLEGAIYDLGGFGAFTNPAPALTSTITANFKCILRVSSWG